MKRVSGLYIILLFVSCNMGYVSVRFQNNSDEDFRLLQVNILGEKFGFEDIGKGQYTKYVRVSRTYPYCFAMVITAKDTLVCQPEDYVGETLYTNGKMIMKLTISKHGNHHRSLEIESEPSFF